MMESGKYGWEWYDGSLREFLQQTPTQGKPLNQIQIKLEDQHKTMFIFPWGAFVYHKMPFILKNSRVTFQRAMKFVFHNLKHIVEACLDDLAAHSHNRVDHLTHL